MLIGFRKISLRSCLALRVIAVNGIVNQSTAVGNLDHKPNGNNESVEVKPFSEIPGPKGLPLIGSLLTVLKNDGYYIKKTHLYMIMNAKKYGRIHKDKMGNFEYVLVYKPEDVEMYRQFNEVTLGDHKYRGEKQGRRSKSPTKMSRKSVEGQPWLDPDPVPKETHFQFSEDYDPHTPFSAAPNSLLLKSTGKQRRSKIEDVPSKSYQVGAPYEDPELSPRSTLSSHIVRESSKNLLLNTDYRGDFRIKSKRHDLSGGFYPKLPTNQRDLRALSLNFPNHANPRVIFISSRIPAAELLHEAVMFGVLPIVYSYNSTTLEILLQQLHYVLNGRQARSIGFFVHYQHPGQINLVADKTTSVKSLSQADIKTFWETLCGFVVAADIGGHVDIFTPLADSEEGMELILQLGIITGMQFSAPSCVAESFIDVNSDWLLTPGGVTPPALYFHLQKLATWSYVSQQVKEASESVQKHLSLYIDQQRKDVISKLTGKIIFDAMSLGEVYQTSKIGNLIRDAIISLSSVENQDKVDTAAYIADYLQGQREKEEKKKKKKKKKEKTKNDEDHAEEEDQRLEEDEEETDHDDKQEKIEEEDKKSEERRTLIVHELFSTELNYMRTLEIIETAFVNPLRAAMGSNKPIISSSNIQLIFGDILAILNISRGLLEDLTPRVRSWTSEQVIGDIFRKFTVKLKTYTNYINNYTVTLSTIEKCQEQFPGFRVFLKRTERKTQTKMLSLNELLILPTNRIEGYVKLLTALANQAPPNHPDHKELPLQIKQLQHVLSFIAEARARAERDRKMIALQKRIENCPTLIEGNRHIITEECVTNLKLYSPIEDLGLLLFNDALVVTHRKSRYFPFIRAVEQTDKFFVSVALIRLTVDDVADTKYAKNVFKMSTPKREWICQASSPEAKWRWISILEKSIDNAIEIES
ncbi:Epithelial cell-transforming sequence 2 oncogene-like [Trichoplax sp. H2]|nr:Epithelial cell-transforming sequence 2 oncogene-like [Trichoplax sp. H2]|eukprot:RDD43577.1 Epithelial cell-transforming sequence 2 oncogene-like [Trichoplax sp. H2]